MSHAQRQTPPAAPQFLVSRIDEDFIRTLGRYYCADIPDTYLPHAVEVMRRAAHLPPLTRFKKPKSDAKDGNEAASGKAASTQEGAEGDDGGGGGSGGETTDSEAVDEAMMAQWGLVPTEAEKRSAEEDARREREREENEALAKEQALAATVERRAQHQQLIIECQRAVRQTFDEGAHRVMEHWLGRVLLNSMVISCWQRWAVGCRLYAVRVRRKVQQALVAAAVSGGPVWNLILEQQEQERKEAEERARIHAAELANARAARAALAAQGLAGPGSKRAKKRAAAEDEEEEEAVVQVPLSRFVLDMEVDGGGQVYDRFASAQLEDVLEAKRAVTEAAAKASADAEAGEGKDKGDEEAEGDEGEDGEGAAAAKVGAAAAMNRTRRRSRYSALDVVADHCAQK